MIAAAALVVAAGAASAQTMEAKIPFAFHVGKRIMEPGTYQVGNLDSDISAPIFRLRNARAHQVVIRMAQAPVDPEKAWTADGNPKLAFACGSGRCDLAEVWAGPSCRYAYTFPRPKLGKDYEAHLTVIPMQRDKSE
jgi:hypothetical protein